MLGVTLVSEAATRGDVKVIESSEDIRYLSQKMVKDYLFLYNNPQKREVRNMLSSSLVKLSDDLRVIVMTTKDSDTKDILEFLAYSKDQIKELFEQKADKEKAALMLDYSETLLEGADSIAIAHNYDFSEEEKMLMVTKEIEYLLERITKYYMAFNVGFNTHTNKKQMEEAIEKLEENLEKINLYSYPYEMQKEQENLSRFWKTNKGFFQKTETLFIPNLLLASMDHLEELVAKIALYHSKNQ
jgi:ERCC4-related helicase